MQKPAYIYALTDPDTGDVCYIGKADNPDDRYRKHMLPSALRIRCRRTSWLRGLLNAGKRPGMTVIEEVPYDHWQQRECYWIAFYRGLGVNLMNTAEGGSGGVKSEWITAESRERMRQAQLGKTRDPDAIRRMADKRIGVPRSPETIAKMSQAMKKVPISPQTRAAQLAAVTGVKPTAEVVAKRTAHSTGNRHAKKYDYLATALDGREYTVESLSAFCKEHGLTLQIMSKMAKDGDLNRRHKGWRCSWVTKNSDC